jgi:hypothetical protein
MIIINNKHRKATYLSSDVTLYQCFIPIKFVLTNHNCHIVTRTKIMYNGNSNTRWQRSYNNNILQHTLLIWQLDHNQRSGFNHRLFRQDSKSRVHQIIYNKWNKWVELLLSLLGQYQHYNHKMPFLLHNFGPP